jgi:membrane associated rhomboid family serine protease
MLCLDLYNYIIKMITVQRRWFTTKVCRRALQQSFHKRTATTTITTATNKNKLFLGKKATKTIIPTNRLVIAKLHQYTLRSPINRVHSRNCSTKKLINSGTGVGWSLFTKPIIFSTFVVTGSFASVAAVERFNFQLPQAINELNQRTPYLFPFVGTVILSNIMIFGLWNKSYLVPRFITKYFLCQHGLPHVFSTLGSTFSHQNFMHLGFNMFALYSFGRACCHQVGSGDTAAMYLSTGVISSSIAGVISYYHPILKKIKIPSLGASGAVLGLVSFLALSRPEMEISLIFLPMYSFPAIQALGALVCFDCIGLILGWKALGHAAHLAGVGCGAVFYYGGLDYMRTWKYHVRRKVDAARRWYRNKTK